MLEALGPRVTRRIHRNERSSEGYLLTTRHYLDEDQEWQLGLCYAGIVAAVASFAATFLYVGIADARRRVRRGGHSYIRLGHWSDLSLDMKILIPLTAALFALGKFSAMRLILVLGPQIADQPRSNIGA